MDTSSMESLIKLLSANTSQSSQSNEPIKKEIDMQYPYGDFPIRYTKSGQEFMRKNSEARYQSPPPPEPQQSSSIDISTLVTLMSLLGGKKKSSSDMLELISPILFKNNPELKSLLKLFNKDKPKEIIGSQDFPNTNKVSISSLKRVE